ncbi:substrate-binding domain-containing protein [Methyloraptor flagellatus]|uniref:Substrate-binding domain-containing protein n=1 Tax=Methyloraptor flagellatus TaxID=3162530 RepID=A0AAU7XAQ7_9HYPH
MNRAPTTVRALVLAIAVAAGFGPAAAQYRAAVVSNEVFRVCADPSNLPFSNKDGQGFENKIAELIAAELKLPLQYFWMPSGPGFIRNTLGTKLCDVVIGYAAGAEIVQNTNPYYRSAFVLITKKDSPLADVTTLADPRLKDKRIGIIAGTPPSDYVLKYGLMGKAKPYALIVDRRYDSPAEQMLADIAKGDIDAGVLWGPIGGYFATKASVPMVVTPLVKDKDGPPMAFRITFGTRFGESEWKHRLNDVIKARQNDIDKVLVSFGVPILDESDRPITPKP